MLRVRKPKHQRVEYPALDVTGADRLILAAKPGEESALYTLAVQTGLRQGELLALTWEDVDLDRARLHLWKTLTKDESGRLVRTEPKTERSVRDIPLPKRALLLPCSRCAPQATALGSSSRCAIRATSSGATTRR
ncbi:MAG: site-specific integrase [Candidatus Eremiobacteraeota bacterium]|nr:site-specific integrase [Candidatus Eremiobacteraeota bacterium]